MSLVERFHAAGVLAKLSTKEITAWQRSSMAWCELEKEELHDEREKVNMVFLSFFLNKGSIINDKKASLSQFQVLDLFYDYLDRLAKQHTVLRSRSLILKSGGAPSHRGHFLIFGCVRNMPILTRFSKKIEPLVLLISICPIRSNLAQKICRASFKKCLYGKVLPLFCILSL